MLLPAGCALIAPLAVFRTFAPAPSSKNRTDDVPGRSTACCITVPPEATGPLHAPVAGVGWAGRSGWRGGPARGRVRDRDARRGGEGERASALSQSARRRGRAWVLRSACTEGTWPAPLPNHAENGRGPDFPLSIPESGFAMKSCPVPPVECRLVPRRPAPTMRRGPPVGFVRDRRAPSAGRPVSGAQAAQSRSRSPRPRR